MISQDEITDDPTIADDEVVWRRISASDLVDDVNLERKRPTSACFLQGDNDDPVSVYLASKAHSPKTVKEEGNEPFLAAITVRFVRTLGLGVRLDPSSGGAGHAVLTGRKTHAKRAKLAKEATWVAPYAP